jgi:hypothetical protein
MNYVLPLGYWWTGIVSFLVCYVLHIIFWNRTRGRRNIALLLTVFFIFPLAGFLVGWGFGGSRFILVGLIPVVVHVLTAANYVAIYPAFEASSPTVTLLDLLHRFPGGLTLGEIEERIGGKTLVHDRVQELVGARFITPGENSPGLTWRGNLLASIFVFYRRLLGLSPGGG